MKEDALREPRKGCCRHKKNPWSLDLGRFSTQDIDMIDAGLETDRIVCDAFRITPRKSWEVLSPDGKTTCFSGDSKGEVEQWHSEFKQKFPTSPYATYHPGYFNHYPKVSSHIADAWIIVDVLRDQGHLLTLSCATGVLANFDEIGWSADFRGYGFATALTAPLAICRAALKGKLGGNG